jgi:hypothetical protein
MAVEWVAVDMENGEDRARVNIADMAADTEVEWVAVTEVDTVDTAVDMEVEWVAVTEVDMEWVAVTEVDMEWVAVTEADMEVDTDVDTVSYFP